MPLSYFILKCGRETIADEEGIDLPGIEAARGEASAVMHELTRHREGDCRRWRLEVRDDYLMPCFEIVFADIDETVPDLKSTYRKSIELTARLSASLDDTWSRVRASMREVRSTMARADTIVAAIATSSLGGYPTGDGR